MCNVIAYIRIYSSSYDPEDEAALMSIRVPLLGWTLDVQRPTVSFVDAPDTVVPGLAGMFSRSRNVMVAELGSVRCACAYP